jgi:hypothetical protein
VKEVLQNQSQVRNIKQLRIIIVLLKDKVKNRTIEETKSDLVSGYWSGDGNPQLDLYMKFMIFTPHKTESSKSLKICYFQSFSVK